MARTLQMRASGAEAASCSGRRGAKQFRSVRCCMGSQDPGRPSSRSDSTNISSHGSINRREMLVAGAASAAAATGGLVWPAGARAGGTISLGERITATSLVSPGTSLFSKPGLVFHPRWLFGTWSCTATFEGFEAPLGDAFVEPALLNAARAPLEQGGLGSTTKYELHFYSTLPDTFDNQLRVQLGFGMPRDEIVQDRAFNTRSTTNAFLGWDAVASVQYDAREAPDRQTVEFARISPDMRPLPPKRIELYLNNQATESDGYAEIVPGDSRRSFVVSELSRQVTMATRNVQVQDYEVLTEYVRQSEDTVTARQVSAVYLDPRHPRYFNAAGRAVAIYRYSLVMSRVATPTGDGGSVTCVETPKDVVQCI